MNLLSYYSTIATLLGSGESSPPPGPVDGTPAPTIPGFNFGGAVEITAGQDAASIVSANGVGTHFLALAGSHDIDNMRMKTNQYLLFSEGASANGSGNGYFIRPESSTTTGVTIGGLGATRPHISNYGLDNSNQEWGAIQGRPSDPLGSEFAYENVTNWFIYHLNFEENSSNAIKLGDYWTVYDCEIHGHTITGINGDRCVGGLIHSTDLYWNALDPATGIDSNGANVKITFLNGGPGRTSITPIDRTPATFIISNCNVEGFDRGGSPGPGGANNGIWFDLDCQDSIVEFCNIKDHIHTGVFYEGCNDGLVRNNVVDNCDGYGPAYNANYVAAALSCGESTNITFTDNIITNSTWAMMSRLSNRGGDWLDPSGPNNYGYSAGPRYWLLDTTAIPSVPGQSNIWTANNYFYNNVLNNCGKVVINEGTDSGLQTTHGAINPANIVFAGNDYSGSSGIEFHDRSLTALTLSQWQALGRQ